MSEQEVKLKPLHPIPRTWTSEEEADLLLAIKTSSREEVAQQLNRTPNAIIHRLKKVATRMNKADETLGKIIEATRLNEDEISDLMKVEQAATLKPKKKPTKTYATAALSEPSAKKNNSLTNVEASLARIEILLQKILEK